jgi:hypothetical protein
MEIEPLAPMDETSAIAGRAVVSGSAAIARLVAAASGLAVTATGTHEDGIGHVDFVLVDLTPDLLEKGVDRKDVDYAKPPTQVAEAWDSSIALTAERPYRLSSTSTTAPASTSSPATAATSPANRKERDR